MDTDGYEKQVSNYAQCKLEIENKKKKMVGKSCEVEP